MHDLSTHLFIGGIFQIIGNRLTLTLVIGMSLEIKRLNLNKSSILKIERSMHELIDINNTQIIAGKKWVSWQLVADDKKLTKQKFSTKFWLPSFLFFFQCQELPCSYLVVRVMSYLMVTRK